MGEGKASQEAEIIDELEDFFDDQNPSDELITNAHEEFEVFDKGNSASAQFISDNVARFEVAARPDVATKDAGDNRLRKQDVLHSSEVLVVNVMSREDDQFSGDNVLKSLVDNGLVFGEMNIFHRYASQDNEDSVLFSVANILLVFAIDRLVSRASWDQAAKNNERENLVQSLLLNEKTGDKFER